jgi:hypothetical protein
MSLLAALDNIIVEQGAAFSREYTYENEDGTPISLAGYTAAMKIKPYYGGSAIISLTHSAGLTLGGALGTVLVEMTATETAAFTFLKAKYDIELYPAGAAADAIRLVEGDVALSQEVTV